MGSTVTVDVRPTCTLSNVLSPSGTELCTLVIITDDTNDDIHLQLIAQFQHHQQSAIHLSKQLVSNLRTLTQNNYVTNEERK